MKAMMRGARGGARSGGEEGRLVVYQGDGRRGRDENQPEGVKWKSK